jgi:hypothetical protein
MARDNLKRLLRDLGATAKQGARQLRETAADAPQTHGIVARTQLIHLAAKDAFQGLLRGYNDYLGDSLNRIRIHLEHGAQPASPRRSRSGIDPVRLEELNLARRRLELRTVQLLRLEADVVRQAVDRFSRWYADIFKGIDREHEREAVGELLSSLPGPAGALGLIKSVRKILMSRAEVAKPAAGFEKSQRSLQARLWQAGVAAELLTSLLAALVAMKKGARAKIASIAIGDAEREFAGRVLSWDKKLGS